MWQHAINIWDLAASKIVMSFPFPMHKYLVNQTCSEEDPDLMMNAQRYAVIRVRENIIEDEKTRCYTVNWMLNLTQQ